MQGCGQTRHGAVLPKGKGHQGNNPPRNPKGPLSRFLPILPLFRPCTDHTSIGDNLSNTTNADALFPFNLK